MPDEPTTQSPAESTQGNAMDYLVAGIVFGLRRFGTVINFGMTPGSVVALNAEQAEAIGRNLLAAAELARSDPNGGYGLPPP